MDARKLKEKATEAFSKGKFAKAGEAYAEYCAADPKDLQARLRMGDAWSKAGQKDKAIGAYQFAAEGFAKEGFLPRAIAASKLILELDPSHKGVQKMLAELYARKTGPAAPTRTMTAQSLKLDAKHAPIELPKEAAAPPLPPPEPPRVEAPAPSPAAEEVIAIEVESSSAPSVPAAGEIELDVSVTGGGVPPVPPPPPAAPPVASPGEQSAQFELHVEEPVAAAVLAPAEAAPPAPPAEEAPPKVELTGKTESGAYDLDLEPPEPEPSVIVSPELAAPPAPAPEPEPEPVRGVPEISELQKAEESGRFKRAASGAYELDLDDDALELQLPGAEEPVALTKPKSRDIDEAKLAAELATAEPEPIIDLVPKSPAPSAPPGLKPKPAALPPELVNPPGEQSRSRIWLPNNVVSPPSENSQQKLFVPQRLSAAQKQTDLEKSLAAFAAFDDEVQIIEPAAAPEPTEAAPARHAHTFTELELEGDSLLHAVETAAAVGLEQRGQEAEPTSDEEQMEALEEIRIEPGALPKIPLFSDLPEEAFIALFERCPLKRLEPGELVIQQGSLGDSFFVICAGSVKVYRVDGEQRRDIATLNEGAFFGEMALLSGAARTASVEAATEDTQLLEISAPILTELSLKHPPVASALKKFCRQRLLTNVMSSSALFAPFSRTERRSLVERFRARDVQKGDVLIKEGNRSDGMYIVLSGEIEVRLGQRPVAALKEGDIFGEMSLLTKAPATATCAAARRTSLLRLPREDFDQIVLSHPQILVLVSELTDERNKQNAALASRATQTGATDATPMV